ncbi:acyltransferase family protein [Streptomyces longispororuber]|uniref:acyltransferase family protein n=1 Tax=Streptomyces longispororuber TaxID=68230 RepID=UPI002108D822|nr:acyltransferase [Streptomyces longispororuber]
MLPAQKAHTLTSAEAPDGRGVPAERLPSLTGLRFFAAFLVFLCHALSQFNPQTDSVSHDVAYFLLPAGPVGVSFFFVLSGFVLTYAARPGDTVRRFWRRRVVKIYPSHVVTWSAGLVLAWVTGAVVTTSTTAAALLLVQAWWPDMILTATVNPISWTLACELFFYLLFPFLYQGLRRLPRQRLWPAAGILVALVMAVPHLAKLLPGEPMPLAGWTLTQFWLVYTAPPVRLLEFALGIVLALLVREGMWPLLSVKLAAALCVAGYAVAGITTMVTELPHLWAMSSATVVPLAVLIATAARRDRENLPSLARRPRLVRLGELSFAFYLVHHMILTAFFAALPDDVRPGLPTLTGMAVVLFFVCWGAAWLLHTGVELPAMRRWSRPRAASRGSDTPHPAPGHSEPLTGERTP